MSWVALYYDWLVDVELRFHADSHSSFRLIIISSLSLVCSLVADGANWSKFDCIANHLRPLWKEAQQIADARIHQKVPTKAEIKLSFRRSVVNRKSERNGTKLCVNYENRHETIELRSNRFREQFAFRSSRRFFTAFLQFKKRIKCRRCAPLSFGGRMRK